MESRNVKALYRRAQAYIQLADLDLAEFDIKKALEIDPDNRHVFCCCWISGAILVFAFCFGVVIWSGSFCIMYNSKFIPFLLRVV